MSTFSSSSSQRPSGASPPASSSSQPAPSSSQPAPLHLRPTAELAERVLLPGDPGRALALAQMLIAEPRMFNHHRGLWGYTGPANHDGEPLTIQSTGMGGPSTAIVVSELVALGARRAIRVGTCGALDPGLQLGDVVVAREAVCADGASRALVAGTPSAPVTGPDSPAGSDARVSPDGDARVSPDGDARVSPDGELTEALLRACPRARAGSVLSVDLFYDPAGEHRADRAPAPDALAIEMEAATQVALGASLPLRTACLLAVTDAFQRDTRRARARLDDRGLLETVERMGAVAVAALAA